MSEIMDTANKEEDACDAIDPAPDQEKTVEVKKSGRILHKINYTI